MQTFLHKLAKTDEEQQLKSIEGTVNSEEFSQAFKAVHESMSSSPSGLHYTIWKCIAHDEELARVFACLMSIPFETGIVNRRWTKCIEVMLKKKLGIRQLGGQLVHPDGHRRQGGLSGAQLGLHAATQGEDSGKQNAESRQFFKGRVLHELIR